MPGSGNTILEENWPKQEHRLPELDSLRGLAALSVVFLHFRDMFFPNDHISILTHRQKVLIALTSPFNAGHPAVLLFFALSGFVLALPYLRGKKQPYREFLGRRVVRIYGPYVIALGIAVAGDAIWHGHLGLGDWAEQVWSRPVSVRLVMAHLLFLGNYDWVQFNPVFWSLVYEMRISLIFPFLFAFVNRLSTGAAILVALACPLATRVLTDIAPGSLKTMVTLNYVAIFLCGILIAKNRKGLNNWYRRRGHMVRIALASGIFGMYTMGHLLPHLADFISCMGALGYLFLALNSGTVKGLLNHTVPAYLGRISYSLYLVHVPILFALAFILNGRVSLPAFFGIYVTLALIGGSIFYALVEEPFIRLSKQVGERKIALESIPVAGI